MAEKTIDELLSTTQKAIRVSGNLEARDNFQNVSIAMILNDISQLSENMNDSMEVNAASIVILPQYHNAESKLKFLRKLDTLARKSHFYERKIRPTCKEKFQYLKTIQFVNGNALLQYDDEAFIVAVYRTLLQREPEKVAVDNGLLFLSKTENKKVDFIYNVLNSPEGKNKNIKIKGLAKKRVLLACKRKIYRIPLIGYLIRWGVNLILLPKRFNDFQRGYDFINYQIKLLNLRADNIEQQLEKLKDDQGKIFVEIKTVSEINHSEREKRQIALQKIEAQIKDWQKVEQSLNWEKRRTKETLDEFYVEYNEELLPDSRENVMQRTQIYIERLNQYFSQEQKENLKIVDLGCGECEWLELLQENGYMAIGIDNNTQVVKKVRKSFPQFKIEEENAFDYLKQCENTSLNVITSFHMVEHLEIIEIIELIQEAFRVLKKGGVLILETPNPQNILIASYYFYLDPTHKKPLPPELLEFLVKQNGFSEVEKILLHPLNFEPYEYKEEDPIKDIVFRFNMEQAYSIWAVKK